MPGSARRIAYELSIRQTGTMTTTASESAMQQSQRPTIDTMVVDPGSASLLHNRKPAWYFHMGRGTQATASKKVSALVNAGIEWEKAWLMVKEVVQQGRLDVFKDIEACLAYKDPSIPFAVDQPLPDPFFGCNTEEERLAAAIASPKPRPTPVRRALDRLARVPARQDKVGKEEAPPASPFTTPSKKAAKRAATCDQSDEEDTSPVYQRLVDSCAVSLWNWIHKNELDAERAEASRLTKRQKERERKKRKEACEVAEKEAMNEGQQDDILERANKEVPDRVLALGGIASVG